MKTLLIILFTTSVAFASEYGIGGPLAGEKLPLFPTENGEVPGYPGCVAGSNFKPEGQSPERLLYPGSVEHWRAYMFKYHPTRSFFDQQSLIKNWLAKDIPGVAASAVEQYAAPLSWVSRYGAVKPTGKFWKPQSVVRCKIGNPVLKLDLGELRAGLYCLRVVGAVETKSLQPIRKPLYFVTKINDGPKAEVSRYRQGIGYEDEFYSVSELYFHATEKRRYQAEMTIDEGSQVELLVHNIDLHDALAGIEVRAIKTRSTLFTPGERELLRKKHLDRLKSGGQTYEWWNLPSQDILRTFQFTPEQRLARDAAIWNSFPRINTQMGGMYSEKYGDGIRMQSGLAPTVRIGFGGMEESDIYNGQGEWKNVLHPVYGFRGDLEAGELLMVNEKLGLKYTMADLAAQRPLPDPYPFKDDGAGLYWASGKEGETPQNWLPVAYAVSERIKHYLYYLNDQVAPAYHVAGIQNAGRDAALMLVRLAYDFPTLDQATSLNGVISVPGGYSLDQRHRKRITEAMWMDFYSRYGLLARDYDWLFDILSTDAELAKSVNRFVPWVKTPKDVVALVDSYLLRTIAKRILRYHWYTGETQIVDLAVIQDDRKTTDPWMEWAFSRTWVYPLPLSGLPDLMITGCDRNGPEYIGSTFYAGGENAMPKAKALEKYIKAGGNPQYNLSDPNRYPKPIATCYWQIQKHIAGLNFLRIGDVAGPDKAYGSQFDTLKESSRQGWKWTHDPKFAWTVKYGFGRSDETDAEWAEMERAAALVKRAPWLDQTSRSMPQWAAILETGLQHDDFRFRRAVAVRTGMGWGHHHNDTLDLQVYAHGMTMTCDGGQRPGYSKPGDVETRMHNVVEVDGMGERDGQWLGHSWTRTLTDAEGARYEMVEAVPTGNHPNVKLNRRQVALIDVDEGTGSKPLSVEQTLPNAKLDKGVTTANSYVFDVVRVSGGRRHTYCFHGNLSDEVKTNIEKLMPFDQLSEKDKTYIRRQSGERLAGDAPDHLVATWAIQRAQEESNLGVSLDKNSPPKFTRLHVLGAGGARVLRGSQDCSKWNYQVANIFVQRRHPKEDDAQCPADLESAFVALIEPYAGEPFLTQTRRIQIPANDTGATQAVAVELKTKNGHTDLCYADGQPDKTREWNMTDGAWKMAGEFGYVSKDKDGLRQATLTGGTFLQTPDVILAPAMRERMGKVTKVDYLSKTMWVEGEWRTTVTTSPFEVGTGNHWTTYTPVSTKTDGNQTRITVEGGADYYLSRVGGIDSTNNTVYCGLGLPLLEGGVCPGIDKHWVASNASLTKFWRATYLGGDRAVGRYGFKLDGSSVQDSDFGETKGFRLWEYGVGDNVRQSTFVNLRRIEPGVFELSFNIPCHVGLRASDVELSTDGRNFRRMKGRSEEGLLIVEITEKELGTDGKLWLRKAR